MKGTNYDKSGVCNQKDDAKSKAPIHWMANYVVCIQVSTSSQKYRYKLCRHCLAVTEWNWLHSNEKSINAHVSAKFLTTASHHVGGPQEQVRREQEALLDEISVFLVCT